MLSTLRIFSLLTLSIFLFVNVSVAQESFFEKGKKLYDQEKYTEAIPVFLQGTKLNETRNNAQLWHYLGLSYFYTQNYTLSVSTLEKATSYDKKNAELWNDLGFAYSKTSNNKQAIKSFKNAIKYDPKIASYRANLAYVYLSFGKYGNAQSQSKEAIKLDPTNVNAHYFRGVSYLWEGEFEKSISDAEKVIEFNSEFANAYLLKSDSLLYKFGNEWGNSSVDSAKVSILKEAIDTLNECLAKCKKDDHKLAQKKLDGLNLFYEYFERRASSNFVNEKDNPNYTEVKILSKIRPGYTNAARSTNTKGLVRIAVLFSANGEIENTLILKGLPFGLTERALNAANQLRFEPAKENGKPISTVKVVVFNFTIN